MTRHIGSAAGGDHGWLAMLAADFLRGVRRASRSTGRRLYAVTAALCFAGAAAILALCWSVVNGVLLRPLPYNNSAPLVVVSGHSESLRGVSIPLTGRFVAALEASAGGRWSIAAQRIIGMRLIQDGAEVVVPAASVTGNFFQIVAPSDKPRCGELPARRLEPTEAVISARMATTLRRPPESLCGGHLAVAGGHSLEIIAVLPENFRLSYGEEPDVRVAFPSSQLETQINLQVIARLSPGVTEDALHSCAAGLLGRQDQTTAEFGALAASTELLAVWLLKDSPTVVATVSVVIGIVFLAGLGNVGLLAVARSWAEAPQTAMRIAVGASPIRLITENLGETALLGGSGAVLGWLIARAALPTVIGGLPPGLHWSTVPQIDGLVTGATAACVVVGVIAVTAARSSRMSTISHSHFEKAQSGGVSGGRDRAILQIVVCGQVAITVAITTAAIAALFDLSRFLDADLGFDSRGMYVAKLLGPRPKNDADREERRALFERAARVVDTVVSSRASLTSSAPLEGPGNLRTLAGESDGRRRSISGDVRFVDGSYYRTVGLRCLRGQYPERGDGARAAVIDQEVAARVWPGEPAIGKEILIESGSGFERVSVAAVVERARNAGPLEPVIPTVYLTGFGSRYWSPVIVIRTPARDIVEARLVELMAGRRSAVAISALLDSPRMRFALQRLRFYALSLPLLALISSVLAISGLSGLLGQVSLRSRRSLAIRVALGASPLRAFHAAILWLVVPTLLGLAGGAILGLAFLKVATVRLGFVVPSYTTATLLGLTAALVWISACVVLPGFHFARQNVTRLLQSDSM